MWVDVTRTRLLYYVEYREFSLRGIYCFAGRDGDSYRMGVEIITTYLFHTGMDANWRCTGPIGNTEPLQLNASTYRPFLRWRIRRYHRIRDVPLGATVDWIASWDLDRRSILPHLSRDSDARGVHNRPRSDPNDMGRL